MEQTTSFNFAKNTPNYFHGGRQKAPQKGVKQNGRGAKPASDKRKRDLQAIYCSNNSGTKAHAKKNYNRLRANAVP